MREKYSLGEEFVYLTTEVCYPAARGDRDGERGSRRRRSIRRRASAEIARHFVRAGVDYVAPDVREHLPIQL